MKQLFLNVITGLPRSGSTLLCNILAQNPEFTVSSTSPLSTITGNTISTISTSPEYKSMLINNKDEAELKLYRCVYGTINGWYPEGIVFDKGRGWSFHSLTLRTIFPNGKLIVLVRDVRNVVASIEKQHRINPLLDDALSAAGKTVYQRTSDLCSPEGMVGSSILGVEDCIRRNVGNCILLRYEDLVKSPEMIISGLYKTMNLTPFEHNFEKIENTATDADGLYLHKFPHEGSGAVKASESDEWKQFISIDIAKEIMNRFNFYNNYFGYV